MLRPCLPLSAALLASCLLSACHDVPVSEEPARLVRTLRVSDQANALSASYSGEVAARREAAVGFMVSGRIQKRLVEVGDVVRPGTPLFQLDPSDANLNANAYRTNVDSARAQLLQSRADYKRYADLAKANYVSKADLEKAALTLHTAEQTLRSAEANYGVAANQARYTLLRASVAGVVTSLEAEAGQVVEAGQPVLRIAEHGEREVVINIPESRVEELRSAGSLRIELWANPQHPYVGRLRELAPDTDSVTRTYSARISILDADASVRLGMTAKVMVALPATSGLRRLPLTAIHDVDGTPGVWIVDVGSQRVTKRAVTLSSAQKESVLISAGLRNGDIVVTAGVNLLHEGQKVRTAVAANTATAATPVPATTAARPAASVAGATP